MKNWYEWKCSMDMQPGHATWTSRMCMHHWPQHGYASGICSTYMQHGHAARTCSMDIQHGQAANMCTEKQLGHEAKMCSKDMQQEHWWTCDKLHGHAPWTWKRRNDDSAEFRKLVTTYYGQGSKKLKNDIVQFFYFCSLLFSFSFLTLFRFVLFSIRFFRSFSFCVWNLLICLEADQAKQIPLFRF